MEILKPTNKHELETAISRAVDVLKQGGLIIYPTDTIYGIGVDATNESAIEKVYRLKGREFVKPLSVIVSSIKKAEEYVEVNDLAGKIIQKMLPGPITILLKKKRTLPEMLTTGSLSLGIRIPNSYFCLALAEKFDKPYTTTSANISGMEATSVEETLEQLKENLELIDLVVDVGALDNKKPSTILDISEGSVKVLRQGDINLEALQMVIKKEK